jgi:hypothetical protein
MKKPTLILLAAAALIVAGCSLKEPGSPSWQVQMTVPIADRNYTMTEIVSNSGEVDSLGNWISINQGNLVFNLADSLEPAYIDGELSYDAVDEVVITYVGVRTVAAPGTQSAYFPIDQVAPQIPMGLPIIIPPFNFNQTNENLGAFSEFDWAFLAWGGAIVTVTNNFPMPIVGLTIEVMAVDPPLQVLHLYIPGTLNPGESAQFPSTLPLAQQIDNNMTVVVSGQSPGTTTPVTVGSEDNIQVDVALSDMGVTQALAHLSPQGFLEDSTYDIEEPHTVRQATISQGSVSYQVQNLTELVNVVTFTLPDFCRDGQPFSEQTTLMPNQAFSVQNRDLAGYTLYRPQGDNMIRAIVTADIIDTGSPLYSAPDSMVVFDSNDLVHTSFQVSPLHFSLFDGILNNLQIDINQPAKVLESMPEGMESLQVASAMASLHLNNTIAMPVDFHLTLEAYKNGVVAASLVVPLITLPAGQGSVPGTLEQEIPGLESIINVLPDSIKTVGYASISGSGTLTDQQYLSGYFHIQSPFAFTVDETTLEPEVTMMDEGLQDELHQVDLQLDLTNAVPISGEALVLASFDSSHFHISNSDDVDTLIRVPLPAAVLNSQGYVLNPGTGSVVQTLDNQELALFRNASPGNPLYVQTKVLIHSTEGDTVRFLGTDHITVGASAHLIVDVNTGKH